MGDHSRGARAPIGGADATDPIALGKMAKRMANDMLEAEKHPLGDTIEAAAFRLQRRYGVRATTLIELRKRTPREMFVSRWMAVAVAWLEFRAEVERGRYAERRAGIRRGFGGGIDRDHHPVLVRIADLVAGHRVTGHHHEDAPRAGGDERG